jgi:ubiquinone/menaquinone biosynthesis C-methylase UbiE
LIVGGSRTTCRSNFDAIEPINRLIDAPNALACSVSRIAGQGTCANLQRSVTRSSHSKGFLFMNTITPAAPDYVAIKERQQATWASGDYAVVGTTLQLVGERLCDAIDLRAGERVLDVAAGNGNATLAAARHFAEVTSTDYVEALLDRGKERAAAERLPVAFRQADAEVLPFADSSFDVALSTFGVMFTPNQEKAASEMSRVVRKGGRIGLANWTPEGFIGQLFKNIGKHVPPPAGVKSPALWGTEERVAELFAGCQVRASKQIFNFRYKSPGHWLEIFKTYYGPTHRAFAALDAAKQAALEADIVDLLKRMNRGGNSTLIVPSEYLEVIITKA